VWTRATGQWLTPSDGATWWFDSGSLALDFGYTGSIGHNPVWERWHSAHDMSTWLSQRFGAPVSATADDLRTAKNLREAIAALADDASAGRPLTISAVAVVDRVAAHPDLPPQLAGPVAPSVPTILSTLARDAVAVFGDHADRIRQCAADDCALIYLDTSRSGNRIWCSMQRCGNRHKVRRLRARHRTPTSRTTAARPDREGDL